MDLGSQRWNLSLQFLNLGVQLLGPSALFILEVCPLLTDCHQDGLDIFELGSQRPKMRTGIT